MENALVVIICRRFQRTRASPGQLLRRTANRRQRIPDLVRQRRAEFGHGLQSFRANVQRLNALAVGDVLKDRRGRDAAVLMRAIRDRGRDADLHSFTSAMDHALGASGTDALARRLLEQCR